MTQLAKKSNIKSLLTGEDFRDQVAMALPKHLSPERFIRVAITATNRTPKLQECTPQSFFQCLLDLSALGLEPDGRRAHLIPYKDQCTLIVDYKGMVELIMRSGNVSSIHADVVCENDVFEYDLGQVKAHKIDFRKPRGEVYAAYCVIENKDGSRRCEVMSKEEIESVRKRSRAANNGPWVTDWSEMAKKTVFRRASKWVPMPPEVTDVLAKEDDNMRRERIAAGVVIDEATGKTGTPPPMLEEPEAEDDKGFYDDASMALEEEGIDLSDFLAYCNEDKGANAKFFDGIPKEVINDFLNDFPKSKELFVKWRDKA